MAINIPLAINRIMPDANFIFRSGDTSDITKLEWLDARTQPSNGQILAAWNDYLLEQSEIQALKQAARADISALVGTHINAIGAAQALLIIKILLFLFGAIDRNGNIKPVGQWEID